MSSERFWVLMLALTSGLAGFAGGVLLSFWMHPRAQPQANAFAAYEARMVETFDLDEERASLLHLALASYEKDVEALKARYLRELEPELAELGRTCRERIRDHVIPDDGRPEFDRLAAGLPAGPEIRVGR
jgi:hypothetical protein